MCASSRWLPTIQCSGEYGKSLGILQIIYNIEVTQSKLRPHLEGSLRFRRQPDPRTVTSSKTYITLTVFRFLCIRFCAICSSDQ